MADIEIGYGAGGAAGRAEAIAYAAMITGHLINAPSGAFEAALYERAEARACMDYVIKDMFGVTLESPTLAAAVASPADAAAIAADATLYAYMRAEPWMRALLIGSDVMADAILDDATARAAMLAETAFFDALFARPYFRHAVWARDAAIAAIQGNTHAQAAFYGAGSVINASPNGTSWVALSALDPARDYLWIGASWNTSTNRSLELATRRPGSSRAASGPWLGGQASGPSTAGDHLIYAPLTAPYQMRLGDAAISPLVNLRVLDCTAPA